MKNLKKFNRGYYAVQPYGYDAQFSSDKKFVFNVELQLKLLSYALPCIFTDKRYNKDIPNFRFVTNDDEIEFKHFKSLKSAKRFCNKFQQNFPIKFLIKNAYYLEFLNQKKYLDCVYTVKSSGKNANYPEFEITQTSEFFDNLNDTKLSELITLMRKSGFICYVTNEHEPFNELNTFKQAHCFGHGKEIGISDSDKFGYNGYYEGNDNILLRMDITSGIKWSDCVKISKELSNNEILSKLISNYKY